ncbi:methyltransferase domain-containing protein [Streptomyces sp. T-3]|nr:methyltransferase domain-containing protein [Streptomyces sp. T-3]
MRTHTLKAARPYMEALTAELRKSGALRTKAWADAFSNVPRHIFVPTWFEQETNEKSITVWRQQHASNDNDQALAAIYRDATLVTRLDPATAVRVDDTAWTGVATSSSTLPRLMAGMLEDLSVDNGHRVLEIGTGTGYNTALLCHRLGEQMVHSIDVDPDCVRAAEARLEAIDYLPHLVPGDGKSGYPTSDPFDRIIATCSVPHIPWAWISQTAAGGIILADVDLGIEGGLVRLAVYEQHRALGHFTTTTGRFMPARSDARVHADRVRPPYQLEAETRPSTVTGSEIQTHYPFRLLLAFHLRDAELVYHVDDETGAMALQLQQPDGSWARAPLASENTSAITYGGNPALWQQVEAAWQWWNDTGRPPQDRFGYVREPDGTAAAWHIPTGRRWNLSSTR